jgi:hypothetical protein
MRTCMASRPKKSQSHDSEPTKTRKRATREMRLPWRSSALASISLAVGKTIYPVCDGNQQPISLPHRKTALYPVQCVVSTIDIPTAHTPLARAERADWQLARAMAVQSPLSSRASPICLACLRQLRLYSRHHFVFVSIQRLCRQRWASADQPKRAHFSQSQN